MEQINFMMAAIVLLGLVAGLELKVPAWKEILGTALLGLLMVGIAVFIALRGDLTSPLLKGLLLLDGQIERAFRTEILFIEVGYAIIIFNLCLFFRKMFDFSNKHSDPAHQSAPAADDQPRIDSMDNKDYVRGPVSDIFSGPLLETPQGIVCVLFSVLNFDLGVISLSGPANVTKAPLFSAGVALILWPIVMFLGFIRVGRHDNFARSYTAAAVLAIVGLMPLAWPYFR